MEWRKPREGRVEGEGLGPCKRGSGIKAVNTRSRNGGCLPEAGFTSGDRG